MHQYFRQELTLVLCRVIVSSHSQQQVVAYTCPRMVGSLPVRKVTERTLVIVAIHTLLRCVLLCQLVPGCQCRQNDVARLCSTVVIEEVIAIHYVLWSRILCQCRHQSLLLSRCEVQVLLMHSTTVVGVFSQEVIV